MSRTRDIHPEWTQAYKDGISVRTIAREHGVSFQAVYLHLKNNDVPTNSRKITGTYLQYTDKQRQRCATLYESGKTIRKVSEITGISKSSVSKILKVLCVETRPSVGNIIPNSIGEQAYNHRKKGHSWRKIQEIMKYRPDQPPDQLCRSAGAYAKSRGLPWPLRTRGTDLLPKSTIKECISLYKKGNGYRTIAKKIGISQYAIARILRKNQIPIKVRKPLQPLNPLGSKIYDMRRKRMKWKDIAEEINKQEGRNFTQEAVCSLAHTFAKRKNVPWPVSLDRRIPFTAAEQKKYLKLYTSGKSIAWIKRNNAVGRERLVTFLQEQNIPIRSNLEHDLKFSRSKIGKLAYESRLTGMKWQQIADKVNKQFGGKRDDHSVRSSAKGYAIHWGLSWPV